MSKFFVGQRVRILWSVGWPELAGELGTVLGRCSNKICQGAKCEWDVAPDCWGGKKAPRRSPRGGNCFSPNSSQLAPAYDGNEVVSWESMKDLWQPAPEHVS